MEACYDGVDNDCDAATLDCDCDGDGVDAMDGVCTGDDCDDADANTFPGAPEQTDNEDNDCDTDVDEGVYCNVFFPMSNSLGSLRTYETVLQDGTTYTEVATISSWNRSSFEGELKRNLSDGSGTTYDIIERRECLGGAFGMSSWEVTTSLGLTLDVSYSTARMELYTESDLVLGTSWTYSYSAGDSFGVVSFDATGTYEVMGTTTITTAAGTFDALEVRNDYLLVDTGTADWVGFELDREGTITTYYTERLGPVYVEDVADDGTVIETRELQAYAGFYP